MSLGKIMAQCTPAQADLPAVGKKTLFITPDNVVMVKDSDGNTYASDGFITMTYAEFIAAYAASELVVGVYYVISYECRHLIPNTTDLNNTNVTVNAETFIIEATGTQSYNPKVLSVQNPQDEIYWDHDNTRWGALVDATSKGFVYRRTDTEKNISMPQDFRGCVFRRWEVDLSALNGPAAVYALYDESVTKAVDINGTYASNDKLTWNATGSANFEDALTFGDYANSQNVTVERVEDSEVLCNMIVRGVVNDCNIGYVNILTTGTLERIESERIDYIMQVPATTAHASNPDIFIGWNTRTQSLNGSYISGFELVDPGSGIGEDCLFYYFEPCTGAEYPYRIGMLKRGDIQRSVVAINSTTSAMLTLTDAYGLFAINIQSWQWQQGAPGIIGLSTIKIGGHTNYPIDLDYSAVSGGQLVMFNAETGQSNIEHTLAAAASLAVKSFSGDSDGLKIAVGVLNLTGSGTVAITDVDCEGKWNDAAIGRVIELRPASGLTINCAFNDVANGFVNTATVSADGTNGERIFIEKVADQRWRAFN